MSQTYGYDHLNRLTSATDSSWLRYFGYDEYGNMSVTGNYNVPLNGLTPLNLGTSPYNAANNRLLAGTYDADGNMTQVGSIQVSYDAEGMQTQTYDTTSHAQANYVYDADGQRVPKTAGGATTYYVHDAFGKLTAEYTTATLTTPPCTTCYLSYDHLGSVRLITDQNANIVTRHEFLPFGEDIPNGSGGRTGNQFAAASNVNQMFTGQERDGENTPSLDFFNARYMSAVLGRFMGPDPYNAGADITNPQTWNGYGYVVGNPLGWVDPSGMIGQANPTKISNDLSWLLYNLLNLSGTFPLGGGGSSGAASAAGSGGPAFANSFRVGRPAAPAKTGSCPSVPNGPGEDVLVSNIKTAEQAAQIFDAQPNGNVMKIRWYYDNERTGGPMDYKNQPVPGAHEEYDEFGQFNFGAVGSALSLPEDFIKQAAGIASFVKFLQKGKLPPSNFGLPWTGPPYGDQPRAQPQISAGYRFTFIYHAWGC